MTQSGNVRCDLCDEAISPGAGYLSGALAAEQVEAAVGVDGLTGLPHWTEDPVDGLVRLDVCDACAGRLRERESFHSLAPARTPDR